jgi:photosystem II stability/assembly factor-like uncharacterized protein
MSKPSEHGVRWERMTWRAAAPAVLAAALALAPGATAARAAGSWQAIGPGGGVALSLAVDRDDATDVYAASGAGGLFKSVDAGRSWSHSDAGLLPGRVIKVVADPNEPGIVYAVTTPVQLGADPGLGGGIFRSEDFGATWAPASSGIDDLRRSFVNDLAAVPTLPSKLYAAADDRVFKSDDGGRSWFPTGVGLRSQVSVLSLVVVPGEFLDTIYAGTAFGVWRSLDGGATWHPARTGMGRPSVVGLAIDDSGRIYAATRPNGPASPRGLFVSADRGATWTARPLAADNPAVSCVTASPPSAGDGAVYACGDGEGLFKSLDGGAHWQPIDRGPQAVTFAALAVAPAAPGILFAGVGGPASNAGPVVYRSRSAGAVWRPASSGIDAIDLSSLAVDPLQAGTLYAGTGMGGVLKTTDEGGSWTPANRGLRGTIAVSALAIDPLAPQDLYVETDGGFFASHNGAARWVRPGAPFPGAPPLAVDPKAPGTVYTTSGNAALKSIDGGATWKQLLGPGDRPISALAIAPSEPATLYLVQQNNFSATLFISRDGGATIQGVFSVKADIPVLAVDPTSPNVLYFEVSNASLVRTGLFKSSDGGLGSVQLLSGQEPVACLIVDPANPAVVYAGTIDGVRVSRDGGATWSELAPGLPRATVRQLAFGPGGTLYAVVVDNGVYRIVL